jgi:putative copper export protein
VVTGVYLMLVNDSYHGVGHFDNAWSVLMLTKHLLIFVMVGLGLRLNNSLNAGGKLPDRFNSLLNAISTSGLLVLLLTAFAQAQ